MRCPRCNNANTEGSPACASCGLPLGWPAPTTGPQASLSPSSSTPANGVQPQQVGVPSPSNTGAPYPYSPLGGYSVLRSLGTAKPASSAFWVGLALLALALVLSICAFLFGLLGVSSAGAQDQSEFTSSWALVIACFFLVFFIPAVVLIAAGRPRRGKQS